MRAGRRWGDAAHATRSGSELRELGVIVGRTRGPGCQVAFMRLHKGVTGTKDVV